MIYFLATLIVLLQEVNIHECNSNDRGYIIDNTNDIYNCDDTDYTTIHELGHYFWYNKMSEYERQQFIKIYKSSSNDMSFITEYAKTNYKEDFAETFVYIFENGNKFDNNIIFGTLKKEIDIKNSKIDFIIKIVGKN